MGFGRKSRAQLEVDGGGWLNHTPKNDALHKLQLEKI